jgi:hypothetical protein
MECRLRAHGPGIRRNLLLVGRTSGLEVGHFRAALGCVQSVRSAAPGARHGHWELPRGTANGSGTAHASGSALAAPPRTPPLPRIRGVFLEVQGFPRGAQQHPPPRNHGVQHHRQGSGRALRGRQRRGRSLAGLGGMGKTRDPEFGTEWSRRRVGAAPRGGNWVQGQLTRVTGDGPGTLGGRAAGPEGPSRACCLAQPDPLEKN